MPCRIVNIPEGGSAIVCSGKKSHKPCSICGEPGSKLCDFFVHNSGKTCDLPLCSKCAFHPNKSGNLDYCPEHAKIIAKVYRNVEAK
jgi:hypothetical protein